MLNRGVTYVLTVSTLPIYCSHVLHNMHGYNTKVIEAPTYVHSYNISISIKALLLSY